MRKTGVVERLGASVILAALCLALAGCHFAADIDRLTVEPVAIRAVKGGEYTGAQRNFPVTAKVRVTVAGGRISDIKMLAHFHGPGHGADAILERVVEAQSLAVDAVSGATHSSKVVLKAIELALRQGL